MKGVPLWPTTMRTNLGDGRLIGVNPNARDGIGSVWLYKRVPLSPMVDAASTKDLQASVAPLMSAFTSLAQSSGSLGGRRLAEATYREFHLLGINVPRRFRPPAGHDLHDLLLESFGDRTVERRLVLLGVRLVPSMDFSAGLGAAIRGFAESLTSTGVPLVEFNKDFRQLDAELSRAGLATPTEGDIRLANCWWSMGRYPDTPLMPHHNHVHVFNTVQQAVRAERNAPEDCADWTPETVPGEYAVTMGAITGFDVNGKSTVSDRRARWFSDLLAMGALCVSMRGKVEPPKVTLGVIRKNKGTYERDIQERDLAGKSGLSDQRGRLAELAMIESVYATEDAPPTLKGLSVVAGFDGNVSDLKDITSMDLALELAPMSDLQPAAMAETYLCSPARGNPALHDVPAHVVGYSGVTSLSVVGDPPAKAVLVGMTETDRQPAWLGVSGASDEDREPYMVVPAATGSGKALTLSTRIPTPTGSTTMGTLRVGDRVLGRDGRPCTVTYLSPIVEEPDLYRLTFSDGQTVVADGNHQWVVHQQSTSAGGGRTRRAKTLDHLLAGQRRQRLLDGASALSQMAGSNPGPNPGLMAGSIDSDRTCTHAELWHLVKGLGLWNTPVGVEGALRMTDWSPTDPAHSSHSVHAQAHVQAYAPVGQARRPWAQHSLRYRAGTVGSATRTGAGAGPVAVTPVGESGREPKFVARIALACLATRVLQRAEGVRVLGSGEEILSTLEMIDLACDGRTGVVVRAAEPLELDPVSCGHDPYRLAHRLVEAPRTDGCLPGCDGAAWGEDLLASFRAYLRGSDFQRLRLLQGLMDAAGCVTRLGGCGLVLDEPRLARAALELIRSLGHVACLWDTVEPAPGPGGTARRYRIRFDTERPVFRRRWDLLRQLREARCTHPGGRAAIGPAGVGRRGVDGGDLGIVSIEPVAPDDPGYGPARCIQVDSPDATYLVEDMIPTHNTMFAQWVAFQASQIPNALGEKTPVVLFNPKQGQSLKAMADAVGAQTFELDELTSADGAIDPLRFSRKIEHGLELAVSVLMSVNPWGDRAAAYELPLYRALDYGIKHGATATGQALHVARDGLNDPVITAMVDDVDVLLTSFPKVRALVGVAPQADGLRLSQGLTLIEVGDSQLNLPTPGTTDPDVTQRTATALVRMMVHGTMSAFTGRQGVVLLDEGWVFTSAGRAEMDRLGRLARALEVFPIILTQKITDALDAGLAGGISRGFIMSIPDETEARAAFELFKIEASQNRMDRVTAGPKLAQGQQEQIDHETSHEVGNGNSAVPEGRAAVATAFNWDSLKALVDSSRVVHRGSVGYYVDLTGRCVPVEVSIPEWFVKVASVNGKDVRAREEANRLAAAGVRGD